MEYRWSRNVWELGLGHIGATLCARYLYDPLTVITNSDNVWELGLYGLYFLPHTDVSPYASGTGGGIPKSNFPYGIPVEPNVPV